MFGADELVFTLPHVVAGTMVLSITAYVLLAGADFGGGVWDLLARGARKAQQRKLIADAIGPVWEANHVWLILVVVMMFSCFPAAFAHFSTELHVPLTLMLVGVVLRGSAFTFRSYDVSGGANQARWGMVFSIASLMTPIILGVCIGTVAAGNIPMDVGTSRTFVERFVSPWITPFAFSVGALTLALFALLAATYLTIEARSADVREDFRKRALSAMVAVAVVAALTLFLAKRDAALVYHGLTSGWRALLLIGATAIFALIASVALLTRAFQIARVAVGALASFIVWGWAWSQYPFLMPPDRTIMSLAAPRATLMWTMSVLIVGTLILLPSFLYLFRVFKSVDRVDVPSDSPSSLDSTHS
ncbi:MAG: cytochrome d ubiquinol oxidase subunit II [Gemmatimonadaceae bacterium]